MTENGVIPWSVRQALELADRLRAVLASGGECGGLILQEVCPAAGFTGA